KDELVSALKAFQDAWNGLVKFDFSVPSQVQRSITINISGMAEDVDHAVAEFVAEIIHKGDLLQQGLASKYQLESDGEHLVAIDESDSREPVALMSTEHEYHDHLSPIEDEAEELATAENQS
ncbi:MAG: hypothetical protein KDD62_13735, partial [Bdellovibrionales bacterium]|nr:hypothetical protein [Bdellovibrionales bacterium]